MQGIEARCQWFCAIVIGKACGGECMAVKEYVIKQLKEKLEETEKECEELKDLIASLEGSKEESPQCESEIK